MDSYTYAAGNIYIINNKETECVILPNGTVTKKPAIRSFPEDMTTVEGRRVEFSVKVSGLPAPTLTWYHDNDQLNDESDCYEISHYGNLTIFKIEPNHSGTYRLVANNSEGSVENQLTLKVMTETVIDEKPDSSVTVYRPVPVTEFGQYVSQNHASANTGFSNLFKVQSCIYWEYTMHKTIGVTSLMYFSHSLVMKKVIL